MARRAPRLRADEHIGAHFTRVGRFRKVDTAAHRELPRVSRLLAALGWAVLLAESLRRAYRQVGGEEGR